MKQLAMILSCLVMVSAVHGQADDGPAAEPENELTAALKTRVSFEADDEYIGDVLERIAELARVNIVLDTRSVLPRNPDDAVPDIEYASNDIIPFAKFEDVPLRPALSAILKPLGLDFSVQSEFIWVTTPQRVKHESFERLVTRAYDVKGPFVADANAWARRADDKPIEVTWLLQRLVPDILDPLTGEAVTAYIYNEETKQLVVSQIPSNQTKIEQLLALIQTEQ